MKTILYVHGMGGGKDSRIPNHLKTLLDPAEVQVVIRTYDFDPSVGRAQLKAWVEEVKPDLIIGESLGAIQALRIQGIPHLFVSPSLGAPEKLVHYAPLARFALGRWSLHHRSPVKATRSTGKPPSPPSSPTAITMPSSAATTITCAPA